MKTRFKIIFNKLSNILIKKLVNIYYYIYNNYAPHKLPVHKTISFFNMKYCNLCNQRNKQRFIQHWLRRHDKRTPSHHDYIYISIHKLQYTIYKKDYEKSTKQFVY